MKKRQSNRGNYEGKQHSTYFNVFVLVCTVGFISACGSSSKAPTENPTSEYFFDTSNKLSDLPGFGAASNLANWNPDTREFTVIGYDGEGNKVGEIIFVDTDDGIGVTRKVTYRKNNDVTVPVAPEDIHENSANGTEAISTWSPPLILMPYPIEEGKTITSTDREVLEWPNSIENIEDGSCGGPLNLLTEWDAINHDREITFNGKETIDVDGSSIEAEKITISTKTTNVPSSLDCAMESYLLSESFWVLQGRGVIKYLNVIKKRVGTDLSGEPTYTSPINLNGIFDMGECIGRGCGIAVGG